MTQRMTMSCLFLACLVAPAKAQRIEQQAIIGRPFGVAAVSFPVSAPADETAFRLDEAAGRALYPVFSSGSVLSLLADQFEADTPPTGMRTVLFLFTGDASLEVTIHTPAAVRVTVRPEAPPPRGANRLLARWWRDYNRDADALIREGDYPPLVQVYLTSMLGQRLGLRPPLLSRLRQDGTTELQQLFDLLLDTERLHQGLLRETMAAPRVAALADVPIPNEFAWRSPEVIGAAPIEVETLAKHVPEECFYLRFGSFENYLWLDELLSSYGGDIGRMVTARGQDAGVGEKVREQLATPTTALTKLFGGAVIADVALIGHDLYLQDGAAVGVLLQARNTAVLAASLNQQRSASAAAEKARGATLELLSVDGREVSLLSTPDNRLRSFYVADGDAHLITSSRHLVERFLDVARGSRALADSPQFQHARTVMPLHRDDTIFLFLSTHFLSGLLSPRYQIELTRRTQALVDMELLQLARLAAQAERQPAQSIDDLIAGRFLPAGFGRHADGSGPILETTRVIDSLRGARGTMLPIPDVDLRFATTTEVARVNGLTMASAERWQQLDPVIVGIRREPIGNKADRRERITVDANISPLAEEKYGWILSMLGPPVTQRVVPRDGDILSAQAFVTGGQLSNLIPPHLLFVGVRDMTSPAEFNIQGKGLLQWLKLLRATPGYLGAWPKPGFLDWLPLRGDAIPPDGLSRLLFDVWRWQGGAFSVLSFQRPVLDEVVPQLQIVDAVDPAQIRITVGDLDRSRLRDWVNGLYFQRASQTSVANTRLMHAVSQQLHVPVAETKSVAEQLLDTQLICALGGKYELTKLPDGRDAWRSTAWEPNASGIPETYRAPLLQWFHGLDLSLTKNPGQVTIRAQVDLQR